MTGDLFPRDWLIRVQTSDEATTGPVVIEGVKIAASSRVPAQALTTDRMGIDVEFKCLRSTKPSPNRCTLVLWNLNPQHRDQLYQRNRPSGETGGAKPVNVQIEAGYIGQRSVIFSGDLRELATVREGRDWKTTLAVDDGGFAVRNARFDKGMQFTKGTAVGTVLDQLCKALGLGLGNAAQFEATAQILGVGTTLVGSFTVEGSAFNALTRLCNSLGVTFSIQGGVLQLLKRGGALQTEAIVLSPDTGLLESPERAIDATVSLRYKREAQGVRQTGQSTFHPQNTAVIRAKAMLIPGLVPGRKVQLQSDAVSGNYVITEAESLGQSWSPSTWYASLVLRTYQ